MEIGEVAKSLSLNDQLLIKELSGHIELLPGFTELTEHNNSLVNIIKNSVKELAQTSSYRIQHSQASAELSQETEYFIKIKNLTPEYFQSNIEIIINNLPTKIFEKDAKELVTSVQSGNPEIQMNLFIIKWKEIISERLIHEEITLAEKERESIEKEIQSRINISHEVEQTIQPSYPGKLWDLSKTTILHDDLKHLRHYSKFLAKNKELRQIADELGRAAYNTPKEKKSFEEETFKINEKTQKRNIPDDVVGIIQGDKLTRLLPSEVVYLSDSDLKTDFYYRYATKQLLNHHYQGKDYTPKEVHMLYAKRGEIIEPKGPFIIAIDTSGSMSGYPEEVAKALCFALLQIALNENRQVFVCMFSTSLETFELTNDGDLNPILAFLSKSIKGGTDFEPCITKILELMGNKYKNADVIMISDFIAQRLKSETIVKIQNVKENGNRFNAIKLSKYGKTGLINIFDKVWTFDSGFGSRLLRKIK